MALVKRESARGVRRVSSIHALDLGLRALTLLTILALAGCSLGLLPQPSPTQTLPPTQPLPITPGPLTCLGAYRESNPIAAENLCPGSTTWRQTQAVGPLDAIAGYVAPVSAQAGDPISLYVTTTAATYSYAVYRMGYYHGAGGRLVYQSGSISGIQQPAPTVSASTRTVECPWTHPQTIQTERSWVSGAYLIKLTSSAHLISYSFFVLRNNAERANILFTLPFLTYQAYNLWGGHNLYRGVEADGVTFDPAFRSYAVSFDRPYAFGAGLANFGLLDLPLLNWLESQSYAVSYAADFDLDAPSTPLSAYRLIIISGHSEYWSSGMRRNVTSARDSGTSLAFFGGNDVFWHVRLSSSPLGHDRLVICYKSASLDPLSVTNPGETTVHWRDSPLRQPEQTLLGEAYGGVVPPLVSAPLTLGSDSVPYLSGTSLKVGSAFPGVVSGEYDQLASSDAPANVRVIATSTVPCVASAICPADGLDTANATIYTAHSGAMVFDAGTFQWSWGLSASFVGLSILIGTSSVPFTPTSHVNASFQRLTANLLTDLLR